MICGRTSMHDVAPDYIEPFIGWRAWGVAETASGIYLVSHGNTVWPRREPLIAACDRKSHQPPHPDCSCGIYALAVEDFPYYDYDRESPFAYPVFGTIALYGVVVRGTRGYRAEKAWPTALFLAHRHYRLARPLREAYGVPVRLTNPFAREGR
jgi:hypothetical protein